MTSQPRSITPSSADSVQTKLQALYDAMPPDEQGVLQTILQMAAQPSDVTGFLAPCCTFGLITGPTTGISFSLPQQTIGSATGGAGGGR
jgi:hypothetical protein